MTKFGICINQKMQIYIYITIFPEYFKKYPPNVIASKVSYLPFIYNKKRVYVNMKPCFN
jgi:hypothetical protein